MQRFFSTFPNELPGAGLLLLRWALGGVLFAGAYISLQSLALLQAAPAVAEILLGTLIIVGLWTPIAGFVICLLELGMMIAGDRTIELHLLRAAVGLSLALLGPGSSSFDAHLFGRRRVEIMQLRDE